MRLLNAMLATLAACAAFLATGLPAAAQTAPLVGAWLAEPDSYDAWVESGIDVPWYPLLVVRADGTYTLYRLVPGCQPLADDGKLIDILDDGVRAYGTCIRSAADAAKDRLRGVHFHISAAGRWSVDGARTRFAVERKGGEQTHFAEMLAGLSQMLEREARNADASPAARAAMESLLRMTVAQRKRLATFYSTMYVFDGEAVSATVAGDILRLAGSDGAALSFRRQQPEIVSAAMITVLGLEVSAAQYFRCALARLRAEAAAADRPVTALAQSLFDMQALAVKGLYAEALKQAKRSEEADRAFTEKDLQTYQALLATLKTHAAAQSVGEGKLGRYLGCPDRDGR